jgi:hypothetical protein
VKTFSSLPLSGSRPRPRYDKTLIEVLYPRHAWRSSAARLHTELRRKLRVGRLHAKLPVLAREAVRTELTALISQALSTHLSEVAAAGWRRSTRIQDAATRTRGRAEATEIVVLGEHTITYTDLPCIEIRVDTNPVVRLEVALVVELHVAGIAATLREGRLVELRAGDADVTVALGIAGDRIARRYTTVDLDAVVNSAAGGVGLHLSSQPLPTARPPASETTVSTTTEPGVSATSEPVLAIVELDVR